MHADAADRPGTPSALKRTMPWRRPDTHCRARERLIAIATPPSTSAAASAKKSAGRIGLPPSALARGGGWGRGRGSLSG